MVKYNSVAYNELYIPLGVPANAEISGAAIST
jgi:hypothetical protein